jgi:flagella basal body P-ring formation protein FlgA
MLFFFSSFVQKTPLLLMLSWCCAGFYLASASTTQHVTVENEDFDLLYNKVKGLLQKEINQQYSEIHLKIEPKSIIRQLAEISGQIRAVSLSRIDPENKAFDVKVETTERHTICLSGTYKCSKHIAILNKNIQAGQIITEKDLIIQNIDLDLMQGLSSPILEKTNQIVGMQAKVNIRANNFIRSDQVKRSAIIRSQENIEIVFEGEGFSLATKGKALQSGGIGDIIKVQNIKSRKVLSGVVSDSKTVIITAR